MDSYPLSVIILMGIGGEYKSCHNNGQLNENLYYIENRGQMIVKSGNLQKSQKK